MRRRIIRLVCGLRGHRTTVRESNTLTRRCRCGERLVAVRGYRVYV